RRGGPGRAHAAAAHAGGLGARGQGRRARRRGPAGALRRRALRRRAGGRRVTPPILEATGLGVRHRRGWALRDCSLAVPAGRVAALVGPNGAGKTTLMLAAAGLLAPVRGSVTVRGTAAFVAQDKPLYESFTVAEMLEFGRRTNPRWDGEGAQARLDALGVPLGARTGRLSGGQQAQVAITLALARLPDLIVLD